MSKTPNGARGAGEGPARASMGQGTQEAPRHDGRWTWREVCTVWDHPDWTATEIAGELMPWRTAKAVRRIRERYGRWNPSRAPTCARCGERPVWVESPRARRLGLCKGCYLDEERMRMEDDRRGAALRQMRHRRKGGGES